MARIDPLRNFRYRLEIDSINVAGFSKVAIAETLIDVVEYREGIDPPHMRKLSGLTKYGNITLENGVTVGAHALDLFKWHSAVSAGQVMTQRKKVVIVAQDESGTDAARWVVTEAWPTKYHSSDLQGKGNEVIVEMLELVNEGIERVK
jgi:phage tail-like protein